MKVEILEVPAITVSFDEGKLKGMTIKFYGDNFVGNVLALGASSGKVVVPIEGEKLPTIVRKLTNEEREYAISEVLSYAEARNRDGTWTRKIKFIEE
jgi:hypothetical protein